MMAVPANLEVGIEQTIAHGPRPEGERSLYALGLDLAGVER
jgi:hypothetical protein